MSKRVLLTGGVGLVGSHFTEYMLKNTDYHLILLCRINYAGDVHNVLDSEFIKGHEDRVELVYQDLQFRLSPRMIDRIGKLDFIVHLAANSHVDRSITHPMEFFQDNVIGTVNLLEFARENHPDVPFINFGTDEVFGPAVDGYDYKEDDRYRPSNPYSASKAGQLSAGHSYFVTYGLPVITTYTMNIFGERQFPEKLVPLTIERVLTGEPIYIFSKLKDGLERSKNIDDVLEIGERHWLHAHNSADAILFLMEHGVAGEHYNVVGDTELTNLEMVNLIADIMGKEPNIVYQDYHQGRPGHDRRYALDGTKMKNLGWTPPLGFKESMEKVVEWEMKRIQGK